MFIVTEYAALSCEKKSHFNENIHLTASLRTPQNRKYM